MAAAGGFQSTLFSLVNDPTSSALEQAKDYQDLHTRIL